MGKKSPPSLPDGKDKPGPSKGNSSSRSPEVPRKREKIQKHTSGSTHDRNKESKSKSKTDNHPPPPAEESDDEDMIIHRKPDASRASTQASARASGELSRPRNIAYVVSPFNICVTQYATTSIEIPHDRLLADADGETKKNKPSPSRGEGGGKQRSSRKNNDDRNASGKDGKADEKRKRASSSPSAYAYASPERPCFEEVSERVEELRKHRSRKGSASPISLCSSEESLDCDLLRVMNLDPFKAYMLDPSLPLLTRRFTKPCQSRAVIRGPKKCDGNENALRKAMCRGAVPEEMRRLLLRETSELMNSCLTVREMELIALIDKVNERPDLISSDLSRCILSNDGRETLVEVEDHSNLFVFLPEVAFFRKFDIEFLLADVVPFMPCRYKFDLEMFTQLCDHLLNEKWTSVLKPLPAYQDRLMNFPDRIHSIITKYGIKEDVNPRCLDVSITIGTVKGLLTPKLTAEFDSIGIDLNTGITLDVIEEQIHDLRQIIVSYSNVLEEYINKKSTTGIEQTAWRHFKKEYEVVSYHVYNSVCQTYVKLAMASRLNWTTLNMLRSRFTLLYYGWNCYIRQLQIAETARRELISKSIDPVIWEAAAFFKKRYDQALPCLKYMFAMERFDRVLFSLGFGYTPDELRLLIEDSCDENATRLYDQQNGTQTYRNTTECSYCKLSFTSPYLYKLHFTLHTTTASCRVCFKNCYKMSLLFIHVLEKHPRKIFDLIDHANTDAPRQFKDR